MLPRSFLPHEIFTVFEANGRYTIFNVSLEKDSNEYGQLLTFEVMVSHEI